MSNYQKLKKFLNGRSNRTIDPNTIIHGVDDLSIDYYSTKILTFSKNGKIKVGKIPNENRTVTTKNRINKYLQGRDSLHSKDGEWFWVKRNRKFSGGEIYKD